MNICIYNLSKIPSSRPSFHPFSIGIFLNQTSSWGFPTTSKARIVRASGGHGGVHCARPSGHTHAAGSLEYLGKSTGNPPEMIGENLEVL